MPSKAFFLSVMGVALMLLSAASWYLDQDAGSSTVVEEYTPETVKESSAPVESTEDLEQSSDAQAGTLSRSTKVNGSSGTALRSVKKFATKKTTTQISPARSDALTLGLLGFGAALLLAGSFYDRISTVKFPGGEVILADGTKDLEESVGELKESQAALQEALVGLVRTVRQRR